MLKESSPVPLCPLGAGPNPPWQSCLPSARLGEGVWGLPSLYPHLLQPSMLALNLHLGSFVLLFVFLPGYSFIHLLILKILFCIYSVPGTGKTGIGESVLYLTSG